MDFFENCFQNLKKLGHKIGAEMTEFDRFRAETRQKTRLQVKNKTLKSNSKNALPTSSKKSGFEQFFLEHSVFRGKKPPFSNSNQDFKFIVMLMSTRPSVSYFSSSDLKIPELVT